MFKLFSNNCWPYFTEVKNAVDEISLLVRYLRNVSLSFWQGNLVALYVVRHAVS